MSLMKCLELSTSHLSAETEKKIREEPVKNELMLTVYNKAGFGYYIYFDKKDTWTSRLPEDLQRVINYAIENGADFICFDEDGEEIEELPLYD